jgi:hypothetical protein
MPEAVFAANFLSSFQLQIAVICCTAELGSGDLDLDLIVQVKVGDTVISEGY